MNESPAPAPATSTPNPEVAEAFATLQRQFQTVLVILIILVAVLDCYMWRQSRLLRIDLQSIEPQAVQSFASYQNDILPKGKVFSGQLAAYAATDPGFRPIWTNYAPVLTKLGLLAAPGTPTQPAKAAPSPAAATQPAKSPAPTTSPAVAPRK